MKLYHTAIGVHVTSACRHLVSRYWYMTLDNVSLLRSCNMCSASSLAMAQAWSYVGATQAVQLHLDVQNIQVDLGISLVAINCTWVCVNAIRNLFLVNHAHCTV